jgi:AdoMet-dependent heme synthase
MNTFQHETKNMFSFQWHITAKCNLRCSHCYQDNYSGFGELDLDGLKKIANEITITLSKWGKRGCIAITGGEPLLKDEAFDIINYLESFSETAYIDILTNGTLINENIIGKIKQSNKIRSVQISLDGANAKVHDSIRGINSFEKALTGIRLLRNNDIDVSIMFTLQRGNIRDIPSLIDLVRDEGIKNLTIERFVPKGAGKRIDLPPTNSYIVT